MEIPQCLSFSNEYEEVGCNDAMRMKSKYPLCKLLSVNLKIRVEENRMRVIRKFTLNQD